MNSLIAAEGAGPRSEWWECIDVVSSITDATSNYENDGTVRNFYEAGAAAVDAAAWFLDPIAELGSSVANLLLTYMPPLPELLDDLVGDAGEVQAMSQTWVNIQTQLETAGSDITSAVNDALQGWSGDAADGYRELSELFTQIVGGVAVGAGGVARALQGSSAIIEMVRNIVVQLISSLVGTLVSMALKAVMFPPGVVAIVPDAAIKIGNTAGSARTWTDELADVIRKASEFLTKVNDHVDVALPPIKNVAGSLSLISVTDLISNSEEFVNTLTSKPGTTT